MASEYLMNKYKDVKPDDPVVLTKKEERKNWWHYHKAYILVGAVILLFVGSFVKEMVTKVEPDYQVAYSGTYSLPVGAEESMQALLEQCADDRNGDGQVVVQVNSYVINEEDPTAYASQVSLIGDISIGSSDFFLVLDPMEAQNNYGIFYEEDGTLPEEEQTSYTCESYAWSDCPALNSLDLGMELYLVRRGYTQEEQIEEHAGAEAMWENMISGAK